MCCTAFKFCFQIQLAPLHLGGDGGEGAGEKLARQSGVGGERADARRRSQKSGMQRKRLVTEGPVMLPAKHGRAPDGFHNLIMTKCLKLSNFGPLKKINSRLLSCKFVARARNILASGTLS